MYVVTTPPSLKKIHRRKREKIYCQFCFLCSCWRHKNRKTLMFSFERAQITWAFVISARARSHLKSYLSDHSQHVIVEGACSHSTELSHGVLRGPVLGRCCLPYMLTSSLRWSKPAYQLHTLMQMTLSCACLFSQTMGLVRQRLEHWWSVASKQSEHGC